MTTYNEAGQTYNDVDFLYDGMSPTARAFTVLAGSMSAADDVSAYVKWDTLSATDNGTSGRGLISLTFERTMAQMATVTDQALIRVIDHTTHADIARGTVRSRKPHSIPGQSTVDIIADDIGGLVDDTFIPSDVRAAETMQARITYLWTTYASSPLDLDDLSYIASVGSTLPEQNFAGVTLRQAIEMTISQADPDADYYIDPLGRLHVFTSETNPAPKDIDADAPSGTEIAPEDLDIDYDSNAYANRVYIQGATPDGSGFFDDLTAQGLVNGMVRTAVVQAPDCETSAMATALANMYLGRVSSAKPRGTFSTTKVDGWRAGQNVLVTSADHGLSAQSFRIARVTSTVVRPGTSLLRRYTIEFGGARAGGAGVRSEGLGSGQVVSGQLGGASNVYVTGDGVAVTDGTRVRALIGNLGGGVYGISIIDGSGNVLIDGNQITLTGSTGTISASQLSGGTVASGIALGIAQTTVTSSGVKVNDGTDDRVILGAIGGGDYGLKVVSSDGVTVIIDGTSDMFRIASSGTFNLTGCNGTAAQCLATTNATIATGLTTAPAFMGFMEFATGAVMSLNRFATDSALPGGVHSQYLYKTEVSGASDTKITLQWYAQSVDWSATNLNFRYYILEQVGI